MKQCCERRQPVPLPSLSMDMAGDRLSRDGTDVKCGRLILLQPVDGQLRKIQVFVRVYTSSFEHYAVLYKDQKYSIQSGYISLKNCTVSKCENNDSRLRVTLNDYEGTGLTFETFSDLETDDWVNALQPQIMSSSPPKSLISPTLSPVIPRSPLMPTLEEEEETDEDDV